MAKIVSEIKDEEFDISFSADDHIKDKLRDGKFWKECCFKYTILKIKILEFLYKPIRKVSIIKEELYQLIKNLDYTKRRLTEVLQELKEDGLIASQNGIIKTIDNSKVVRNIITILVLWPYANEAKKPVGGLQNRKLRYYLPFLLEPGWKSVRRILKEYTSRYGPVSRDTLIKALDERNGELYEKKTIKKGDSYSSISYRLKT